MIVICPKWRLNQSESSLLWTQLSCSPDLQESCYVRIIYVWGRICSRNSCFSVSIVVLRFSQLRRDKACPFPREAHCSDSTQLQAAEASNKADNAKLTMEVAEMQKTSLDLQRRHVQFQHELRRKDKEFERLQARNYLHAWGSSPCLPATSLQGICDQKSRKRGLQVAALSSRTEYGVLEVSWEK